MGGSIFNVFITVHGTHVGKIKGTIEVSTVIEDDGSLGCVYLFFLEGNLFQAIFHAFDRDVFDIPSLGWRIFGSDLQIKLDNFEWPHIFSLLHLIYLLESSSANDKVNSYKYYQTVENYHFSYLFWHQVKTFPGAGEQVGSGSQRSVVCLFGEDHIFLFLALRRFGLHLYCHLFLPQF